MKIIGSLRQRLAAASAFILATQVWVWAQGIGTSSQPGPITFKLEADTIAQPLPREVLNLKAGPDGRMWWAFAGGRPTVDQLKTMLVREFKKSQPAIPGITPILFEPSGRVWFALGGVSVPAGGQATTVLVGYDGKDFVEREIKDSIVPDSIAQLALGETALAETGRAFFAGKSEVYSFDGRAWSEQLIAPQPKEGMLRLYPDPDGKGIIAAGRLADQVWRWRDGKWQPVETGIPGATDPAKGPRAEAILSGIVPSRDGMWLQTQAETLFVRWDGKDANILPEVAARIAGLHSDDFATREKATKELLANPKGVKRPLQREFVRADGTELKYRIQYILDHLVTENALFDTSNALMIGDYSARLIQWLLPLRDGSILLCGLDIRDATGAGLYVQGVQPRNQIGPATKGILKIEPDGKATPWGKLDDMLSFSDAMSEGRGRRPLVLNEGVWLTSGNYLRGAALYDLKTGEVRTRVFGSWGPVIAATADGFIYTREQSGIVALNPAASAKLPRLEVIHREEQVSLPVVKVGDGTFWFGQGSTSTQTKFIHFDGADSRSFGPLTNVGMFASAGKHSILVSNRDFWHLLTPEQVFTERLIEDLITSNLDIIRDEWKGQLPEMTTDGVGIQVDDKGAVWLLRRDTGQLRVYVEGHWVDATVTIKAAGGPDRLRILTALGDGSRLYLFGSPSTGTRAVHQSFYAWFADGKVQLEAAPDFVTVTNGLMVKTPDGSVWMCLSRDGKMKACRVSDKGINEEIEDVVPLMMDRFGNLWTRSFRGNDLQVYSHGKSLPIEGKMDFSVAGNAVQSKSGNIYVPTTAGLQEIVAQGSPEAIHFRVGRLFAPARALGGERLLYSPELDMFGLVTTGNGRTLDFVRVAERQGN